MFKQQMLLKNSVLAPSALFSGIRNVYRAAVDRIARLIAPFFPGNVARSS